jgi:hypothetical protein
MGTTIQPTDVEYVPVVATGCWVHISTLQRGWYLVGHWWSDDGPREAGKADNGWRPVWWFTNEVELPPCMCVYARGVHPCMADGNHDVYAV